MPDRSAEIGNVVEEQALLINSSFQPMKRAVLEEVKDEEEEKKEEKEIFDMPQIKVDIPKPQPQP